MDKLTESEEAAIALVAAKTQTHDDAVERFYRNRNGDSIFPENRVIGLFVEVVAPLLDVIERVKGSMEVIPWGQRPASWDCYIREFDIAMKAVKR
jgi:hypothetical protein